MKRRVENDCADPAPQGRDSRLQLRADRFAAVSFYIIGWGTDEVTKGNIIGTWQNFALLAVGFWIGSSSGGKAKDVPPGEQH